MHILIAGSKKFLAFALKEKNKFGKNIITSISTYTISKDVNFANFLYSRERMGHGIP